MAQLNKGHFQLPGEDVEQVVFIHITQVDQGSPELSAGALLLTQGSHQLLFGDDLVLYQQVTDADFLFQFGTHDSARNAFSRSRA